MATCRDCIHCDACDHVHEFYTGEPVEDTVCADGAEICQCFERGKVVHAHWIIDGDWGECSSCHEASKLSVMEHKDYCPACGARMIEEVETDG